MLWNCDTNTLSQQNIGREGSNLHVTLGANGESWISVMLIWPSHMLMWQVCFIAAGITLRMSSSWLCQILVDIYHFWTSQPPGHVWNGVMPCQCRNWSLFFSGVSHWTVENKVHSLAVYLGLGLLALMTDVLGKGQHREWLPRHPGSR